MNGKFVILLNVERVLAVAELAGLAELTEEVVATAVT